MVRGWCTIFEGRIVAPRWILYFEGRIARREGYYLSRVVSCAATDAWTDMSPMGPGLRGQRVCIVKKDASRYLTLHLMALKILLLMNLNMCFADLVIVSL